MLTLFDYTNLIQQIVVTNSTKTLIQEVGLSRSTAFNYQNLNNFDNILLKTADKFMSFAHNKNQDTVITLSFLDMKKHLHQLISNSSQLNLLSQASEGQISIDRMGKLRQHLVKVNDLNEVINTLPLNQAIELFNTSLGDRYQQLTQMADNINLEAEVKIFAFFENTTKSAYAISQESQISYPIIYKLSHNSSHVQNLRLLTKQRLMDYIDQQNVFAKKPQIKEIEQLNLVF